MIMKARDLMIGDWIQDGNSFPMRIVTVGEGWAYADFEGNEADPWEYRDRDFADGTANPVELTAAMLEANGFRALGRGTWQRHCGDETIRVDATGIVSMADGSLLARARKVHELQHVLRLVGLVGLADNFRLE